MLRGSRIWGFRCALGLTLVLRAVPVCSQSAPADPAQPAARPPAEKVPEPTGLAAFVRDVGRDYVNFLSVDNAVRGVFGGGAAFVVWQYDEEWSPNPVEPTPAALKPGATYGNVTLQVPIAVGWWAVGHAMRNARAADAGRDLMRAQISAVSWTYATKYAVGRTRPNGDPRSFPSGHASATFATAMVLHRHYGWKLGVPMFAAAAYTSVERVHNGKHWPSDVTFGAVLGLLCGRTITLDLGGPTVRVQPQVVPGGGGVAIHVLR